MVISSLTLGEQSEKIIGGGMRKKNSEILHQKLNS